MIPRSVLSAAALSKALIILTSKAVASTEKILRISYRNLYRSHSSYVSLADIAFRVQYLEFLSSLEKMQSFTSYISL